MTPVQRLALIHLDEVRSLTALGCGEPSGILTENAMEKFKNVIKDLVQIGLSTGAIVGTEGMGGDTIVDVLFALEESGEVLAGVDDIVKSGGSLGKILKDLNDVSITQGTERIYKQVQPAVARMVQAAGPGAEEMLEGVREEVMHLLNRMARVVGKWISAIIPDDAGLGGPTVQALLMEVVNQASENIYDALSAGFNALPDQVRDVIQDPKKLAAFLNLVVDSVVKFLDGVIDPRTWGERARQFTTKIMMATTASVATGGAAALPVAVASTLGVDKTVLKKLRDHLNTTTRQMIPVAVKAFHGILTSFFVQVAILQVIMSEDYQTTREKEPEVEAEPEAKDQVDVPLAAGRREQEAVIQELRQFVRLSLEVL